MSKPLGEGISVCVLTYNHVDAIESTLESIFHQTLRGYEVIVSDDCSTDGTWERVVELCSQYPSVKAIRTPSNLGMPGNANFAIAHSERPYVALLHHDDLYRDDLLERWLKVAEESTNISFVFNQYRIYNQDLIYSEPLRSGRTDGRWFLEHCLFPRWGCPVRGTAMIRREDWNRVGGMNSKYGLLADVDLWMRLAMERDVGYVPEPLIIVRHQPPPYYPNTYRGDVWSWRRQVYLYEIHGDNRRRYFGVDTPAKQIRWWMFRCRVSWETSKWLLYALIRRKPHMIAHSDESATHYDVLLLRILRRALQELAH